MKTTINRYRNPWHKETLRETSEFYENTAPEVFSYRGVNVLRLPNGSFDYVFEGCCLTQRIGCDKGPKAQAIIDDILDGNQPVSDGVAKHLSALGLTPLTYEQYTADFIAGKRA